MLLFQTAHVSWTLPADKLECTGIGQEKVMTLIPTWSTNVAHIQSFKTKQMWTIAGSLLPRVCGSRSGTLHPFQHVKVYLTVISTLPPYYILLIILSIIIVCLLFSATHCNVLAIPPADSGLVLGANMDPDEIPAITTGIK